MKGTALQIEQSIIKKKMMQEKKEDEDEEEMSMCCLLFMERFVRPCYNLEGSFHYCFLVGMDSFVKVVKWLNKAPWKGLYLYLLKYLSIKNIYE